MTPYEINRAIAKEAGWIEMQNVESQFIGSGVDERGKKVLLYKDVATPTWQCPDDGEMYEYTPDYYSDLNEINKLERNLTDSKDILNYRKHLIQITTGKSAVKGERVWVGLHDSHKFNTATAAQRCEAYLKVKGLWKV